MIIVKQDIIKYLDRKDQWRRDASRHLVIRRGKRQLVLQSQKRKKAPNGMKYALVKTKSPTALERAKTKQEYLHQRQEIVKASLMRGDFEHLSDKTKEIILFLPRHSNFALWSAKIQ